MPKKNIILVPTDFSEVCDNALNHACDLAKHFNFEIYVLHVITKETKKILSEAGETVDDLKKKLEDYVNDKKEKYPGINITPVLREGNLFSTIGDVSREINAGLIVLGTHGKVGFQRITGSYALKVINSTEVPTIVVQKKPLKDVYKNIVFPVTKYTEEMQKINLAISIANAFDATIHIVPNFEGDSDEIKMVKAIVKKIMEIFEEKGVRFVFKVKESDFTGNFAKMVIDYSVINDADLIMIVTRSKPTLALFDSWDEQIIFNSSQIPVMCINPARVKGIKFGGGWSGI